MNFIIIKLFLNKATYHTILKNETKIELNYYLRNKFNTQADGNYIHCVITENCNLSKVQPQTGLKTNGVVTSRLRVDPEQFSVNINQYKNNTK